MSDFFTGKTFLRELFLFVAASFFLEAPAQMKEKKADSDKDSLLQVIRSGHDSIKAMAYYELGSLLIRQAPNEAFHYFNKGQEIAIKRKQYKTLALILQRKGTANVVQSNFAASLPYFDSSLQVYLQHAPQDPGLVSLYNNYAVAYYLQDNNIMALDIYLRGYELCRNDKKIHNYPTIVNNIGLIYKKLEQYDDAIYFLQESAAVKRERADTIGEANSLFNISTIYVEKKVIDSAAWYAAAAKQLYLALGEDLDAESVDLILADLYYKTGDLNKARLLIEPFAANNFKRVDKLNMGTALLVVAGIHIKAGKPQLGLKWLSVMDTVDRQYIGEKELRDMYRLRAEAYTGLENYKSAMLYADSGIVLERKIYEEKSQRLTQEMLARMKTSEKESRIELLEARNTITSLQLTESKSRNQYFIGGIVIFALIAFMFWQLSRKIRHQKKLIEETMHEREKMIAMNAVIEGQEAERARIAKDLHDGLGGLLSTVKSHYSKVEPRVAAPTVDQYEKVNSLIDQACVEVRRIAHNMMPHALSLAGLEGSLEDFATHVRSVGIACKAEIVRLPKALPESKATVIYRIVQELIQNIVKHAAATEVFLQFLPVGDKIHITVEDNGKGFEMEEAKNAKGLGMESIQSRIKYLNGKIQFDSVPSRGTTVTIEIPAV